MKIPTHISPFILAILVFSACQTEPTNKNDTTEAIPRLFSSLSANTSGVDFVNKVEDQEEFNILTYRNYYNGGGVAIGDINNDNLPDLFFTANMQANQLYLNKGNLHFENISAQAGIEGSMSWSTGVTMADINGDGWMDIYVCNSGDVNGDRKINECYINNQDGSFSEQAQELGLADAGFSTHASFFDYDMDGDLDMYLVNNSFKDPSRIDFKNIRHERDLDGGDKLFENRGNKFVDVSEAANIYGSKIGFGLGVSISDMNQDNLPDIYLSNDFWERDYIYFNNGDKTFTESLPSNFSYTSTASMGADIADLNNDGSYDLFSTDMLPATTERIKTMTIFNELNLDDRKYRSDYHYQYTQNCLQFNDGTGNFTERGHQAGVAATDWSWGALIFDFDNDGWKDIFVSNGVYRDITDMDFSDFIEDQDEVKKIVEEKGRFDFRDFLPYLPSTKLSNYAFLNRKNIKFENQAKNLGLGEASFSNGSAFGDLDNDGDLDLVVNNVNMTADIFENKSNALTANNYLKIKCEGIEQNPFGIGAQVSLLCGDQTYHYQNYQSRGFQSATEPILTIGLGEAKNIDQLEIRWPSQKRQVLTDVDVNQILTLQESDANLEIAPPKQSSKPAFTQNDLLPLSTAHKENDYNDFNAERLCLRMMSTEGPKILQGDINGDGIEDMIVLGAEGDEDKVLIQNQSGKFDRLTQGELKEDASYESNCGLLLDLDGDQDLDMIIGVGGNSIEQKPAYYFARTYLNNGKGVFTRTVDFAPKALGNFSSIQELTLRKDGTKGLFFAAQLIPGNYGIPPRNYLFMRVGNEWKDVTTKNIGQTGMLNDAIALDLDEDGDDDLITVGEFNPIRVFENMDGKIELKGQVQNSGGLWQCIEAADLNNDGKMDFVLGNWGENSKLQASKDRPLEMVVKDFDQNDKSENILVWYAPEDTEPKLFASKRDITGQLPFLKKRNVKNIDFANKGLKDVFKEEELEGSINYKVENLHSSILINEGNFNFTLVSLPEEAQSSIVFAAEIIDYNKDNISDILLGGNLYGLKPEIGRIDGSKGTLLKGNKDGSYTFVDQTESGIYVNGEIRDIIKIKTADDKNCVFFGINNQEIKSYAY